MKSVENILKIKIYSSWGIFGVAGVCLVTCIARSSVGIPVNIGEPALSLSLSTAMPLELAGLLLRKKKR